MGANVSKQVNKAMSKNTYESTLDVLNSLSAESKTTNSNVQNMHISMGQGSVTECTNLILTQSIDQKVRNIMNSLSENKTTMENDIVQKAKNNLQNSLKQVNDGLNLGQMNFNNQAQSVIAESEVKIEQRVRNIIETSLSTWNENSQKLEITLNGTLRGEQCNFSQSIISNVISENISKGIQGYYIKNKIVSVYYK